MTATLITGMSAVGKSTAVGRLAALGHDAVDLDASAWSHYVPDDSEYSDGSPDWRWRAEEVRALLTGRPGPLFVSGTCTTQGDFYPLLDHIVLLTAPTEVVIERLETRTTNDYGKDPAELRRALRLREIVEPLLRRSACLVVDTGESGPDEVVAAILAHLSK